MPHAAASPVRRRLGKAFSLLIFAACLWVWMSFLATPARAESEYEGQQSPVDESAGDIGYEGASFLGASTAPSGTKPESKLWFNDGLWWGSLFDSGSRTYRIFKLDVSTQTWVDTGTPLDPRPNSRADALWDGQRLYVASHVDPESPAAGDPSHLYRFSYFPATQSYSLDPGFPAVINNDRTESLVIDKDSTGRLWATWTQGTRVYVNTSTTDDATWGTAFVLPGEGTRVASGDISSLVAFGNKIMVVWSNQVDSSFWYAIHEDGQPAATWQPNRRAFQAPGFADDHINLKALQTGPLNGRVLAAVKTSLSSASDPLTVLLDYDSSVDQWSTHTFGTGADGHTRPLVLIDASTGMVHMFAQSGGAIYQKSAPISDISFATGKGTPVMLDADSADINNLASTKQNLSASTGLVLLATNGTTERYWHAYDPLQAAPTANFTATPTTGAVPLTVAFSDASSGQPTQWLWDFGDGATSTVQSPSHTYAAVRSALRA